MAMSLGKAQIELLKLNAEAEKMDRADIFTWLTKLGVPQKIIFQLQALWEKTKKLANQTISIGKIILLKIIEFCKAHPHAAIGMLLGAACGALVSLIPFIGPLLAPLMTVIGAVYGLAKGAKLDSKTDSTFESLIAVAKDFFILLKDIFTLVFPKLTD